MPEEILFQVRNHIGHITLNRPNVLNALSYRMIVALYNQLKCWADDTDIHAVVVRGAGEKAFCAGGDIRAVYESTQNGNDDHLRLFTEEYMLDHYIHRYRKPYVALLDGIVMGGGMGISQGAWLRLVTQRSRLAMPEVGIGFFPDVGGSYFLSRCPGSIGCYLGITGLSIQTADALYAGLADSCIPHEKLGELDHLLDTLAWSGDHHADLMNAITTAGACKIANAPLAELRPAIDEHFAKSSVAAIVASLENECRPAFADWAKNTLATMEQRSPTMMCVTHEQIQRGRNLSLADCFRMELGMVYECFRQGDFIEGIRALIVDKDLQPQWNPPYLATVAAENIHHFFAERWPKNRHPLTFLETSAE